MGEAGTGVDGQLRQDPASRQNVVVDDRVAVVVRGAHASEWLEEGVAGSRSVQLGPVLVPDGEAQVVPLHVLRGAYVSVDVGRNAAGRVARKAGADAFEADARRRRGRADRPHDLLPPAVLREVVGRARGVYRFEPLLLFAAG